MNVNMEYMPPSPRLDQALDRFNHHYNYHLAVPIWRETVEAAVKLALLRGRSDIADELVDCLEGAEVKP